MKKTRVIVKSVNTRHKIYVEHNGERTLYAVTDKVAKAKDLVLDDRFHETSFDEANRRGTGSMLVDSLFEKS
jgi:hypothetical protein